jgi:hypothetical protein
MAWTNLRPLVALWSKLMNGGTILANGVPSTSGCASPSVDSVAGWCGSFDRPARRPGALVVMPSTPAVSEGSGRGEEVD